MIMMTMVDDRADSDDNGDDGDAHLVNDAWVH